jgi:2-keto-3-deoxy-galactonokinase
MSDARGPERLARPENENSSPPVRRTEAGREDADTANQPPRFRRTLHAIPREEEPPVVTCGANHLRNTKSALPLVAVPACKQDK